MDKVSLAKKTAKLMVDKLSPQELENELYQLLIMLPDSDLDYVHDDVESGNIAGAPLINNPQDTEEYLRTSTYVEGDAFITEDKLEDVQEMLEKSLDKEVTYDEDKMSHLDSFYIFFIPLSNRKHSESAYAIMVAIDEDDSSKYAYSISKIEPENDDDDFLLEGSTKDFDKVLKALEKGVKQNRDEILNTPRYGDGVVTYVDTIDKIVRKLYDENTTTFEKYLEGSDLVRQVDIDDVGVVNIYWTANDMREYITQATPFWADVDEIPIQVETTMGVIIDNGGNRVNVSFPTSLYIDEGFNQFMMSYYDKLPEILSKSKDIVERYEDFQEDKDSVI